VQARRTIPQKLDVGRHQSQGQGSASSRTTKPTVARPAHANALHQQGRGCADRRQMFTESPLRHGAGRPGPIPTAWRSAAGQSRQDQCRRCDRDSDPIAAQRATKMNAKVITADRPMLSAPQHDAGDDMIRALIVILALAPQTPALPSHQTSRAPTNFGGPLHRRRAHRATHARSDSRPGTLDARVKRPQPSRMRSFCIGRPGSNAASRDVANITRARLGQGASSPASRCSRKACSRTISLGIDTRGIAESRWFTSASLTSPQRTSRSAFVRAVPANRSSGREEISRSNSTTTISTFTSTRRRPAISAGSRALTIRTAKAGARTSPSTARAVRPRARCRCVTPVRSARTFEALVRPAIAQGEREVVCEDGDLTVHPPAQKAKSRHRDRCEQAVGLAANSAQLRAGQIITQGPISPNKTRSRATRACPSAIRCRASS